MIALLLGLSLLPAPKAIVDVYGPTCLARLQAESTSNLDKWSERWGADYSVADNEAVLQRYKLMDAVTMAPFGWEIGHIPEDSIRKRWACPSFHLNERVTFQTQLLDYICATNRIAESLVGLQSSDAQTITALLEWSPLHLLRNAHSYPSTAFLHGLGDEDVTPTHSLTMAADLRAMGVKVKAIYVPDAPHAFDQLFTVRGFALMTNLNDASDLQDPGAPGWAEHIEPILNFVVECM
jgi:acetyl esterase/lipase